MADLDDESSQSAKKKSIESNTEKAWHILLKRLLKHVQAEKAQKESTESWRDFLESIQIYNEKASNTRYRASLTYHFNRNALESFFQKIDVHPATAWGEHILLIPFYEKEGMIMLSRGGNDDPFKPFSEGALNNLGLLQFETIPKNLDAQEKVPSFEELISKKETALALAKKHHAGEIMLLLCSEDGQSIKIYPKLLENKNHTQIINIPEDSSQEKEIIHFLRSYDAAWKEKEIREPSPKNIFKATFPIRSLHHAQHLLESLQSFHGVETVTLLSESCHEITLEIIGRVTAEWIKEKVAKNQQKWNT